MSSQLPNCVVWVLFIFQRYWYQKLKNYHFNLYKIIITHFILISSKPEYNIVVKERCWEYVSRLFSYIEKVILNFNFPVFKQNTLLKTHIRYTSNVFFLNSTISPLKCGCILRVYSKKKGKSCRNCCWFQSCFFFKSSSKRRL